MKKVSAATSHPRRKSTDRRKYFAIHNFKIIFLNTLEIAG